MAQAKDHWTPSAYQSSASFVPQLASKITQWLDPRPDDIILDLGCGDGVLSAQIKSHCTEVRGLDSSPSLLQAARKNYEDTTGLSFEIQDSTRLEEAWIEGNEHGYDKVFSNAALHWILRDPGTRTSVLRGAWRALKPGGAFVFEMGGAGNVGEVHAALIAALVHYGVGVERAREACPWFFPSEVLMRRMLEGVGFRVEKMEVEFRPTRLTEGKEGGLEGWVRLMGARMLEVVEEGKREEAVEMVTQILETVIGRQEGEGGMWLGYVRLRVLARK